MLPDDHRQERGPLGSLLRLFLSLHWATAHALAITFVCVGAIGQWLYARAGMDLEALLIERASGAPLELSLGRAAGAALVMGLVAVPTSAVFSQLVLRLVARTSRPFGVAYRVSAFCTVGALGKLIPFVGYFVALIAIFWISVLALRGVYGLKTWRALAVIGLATILTMAFVVVVVLIRGAVT